MNFYKANKHQSANDQSDKRKFFRDHSWRLLLISGIGVLLMLPRLLSAQYGLLDDGVTYSAAQEMAEGTWGLDWKAGSGRFRPMYWILNASLMLLFPENAAGAFAVNMLVLISSGILIYWIVFQLLDEWQPAFLSAAFYILSSPVIETFYTISKAEHFQVLCILFSIFWVMKVNSSGNRGIQYARYFAGFIFISLSLIIKETTLVMVPITIGWVLLPVVFRKWYPQAKGRPIKRMVYAGITILGGAGFWIFRNAVISSTPEGSYASKFVISMDRILDSTIRLIGWLIRDYLFIFPWVIGVLLILICGNRKKERPVILEAAIWMGGWFAIFLPWDNTQEYYLLPFSAGAAVISGWLLWKLLHIENSVTIKIKIISRSFLVIGFCLFPITQLHNYTSARTQLIVDRENYKMVKYLVEHVPDHGYVFKNLVPDLEYSNEIDSHIQEIYGRNDIILQDFAFQTSSTLGLPEIEYYVPSPSISNRIKLSVRVGVGESLGNSRSNLLSFTNGSEDPVYSSRDSFRVFHLDFFSLACPLFPQKIYCSVYRPILDRRAFSYGWDIDKVTSISADQALPGSYRGGLWSLKSLDGSIIELAYGETNDIPVVGDFNGDSFTDLGLFRPKDDAFMYDINLDGVSDGASGCRTFPSYIVTAGDPDGDGVDQVLFYKPEDSAVYTCDGNLIFEVQNEEQAAVWGEAFPVIGDWAGDGIDSLGLYYPAVGKIDLGNNILDVSQNSPAVPADWAGYGKDAVAFYQNGFWGWEMITEPCESCNTVLPMEFGEPEGVPVAGRWSE